ncbi:cytochrome P450 [Mycena floridula]|nr:cytochrome P450 [Mycena floridula]
MPMISSPVLSYLLAGVIWLVVVKVTMAQLASRRLAAIPSMLESSGIIASWFGAFRALSEAHIMAEEGYRKYHGRPFKILTLTSWKIVIGSQQLIDELRSAKDDQLSFQEAVMEELQTEYTLGPEIFTDPYHVETVRSSLTRNIAASFSDTRDEMAAAFASLIPLSNDWIKYPALATITQIICRTSNRVFVGLPLCRNPDFIDLNISFTLDVVKASVIINLFPRFLQPVAAKFLTTIAAATRRAAKHLGPIIQERLAMEDQYGTDWPGKPNDLLTWLIHDSNGKHERTTIEALTRRILTINFGAIHTTSMIFTYVLYAVAERPELAAELREEVETVIGAEGWTKISTARKVLKDFTFSDGTTIPAGNMVYTASAAVHMDEVSPSIKHWKLCLRSSSRDLYPNAIEFDSLRFARMREQEGKALKHQTVSTSSTFLMFGIGKHTCPGRFHAISSISSTLAHILLNYDVCFENGAAAPPSRWFMGIPYPDTKAEVLFRQRAR